MSELVRVTVERPELGFRVALTVSPTDPPHVQRFVAGLAHRAIELARGRDV